MVTTEKLPVLVYNYDPTTGRFTGAEPLEYSAEDGAPLIPAHSTTVQPLPRPEHFFNYWTGSGWELKPDLEKARMMLARRNAALAASDWTMLYDAPLWFWQRWRWMIYRNRLRNLTLHPKWPNLDLPEPPNKKGPLS